MARNARARTSPEVERVRALLEHMTGAPIPPASPSNGPSPARSARSPQAQQAARAQEAGERPVPATASEAVAAWATLSEASPASTFDAHSRTTTGLVLCEPATAEEEASCLPASPGRSEAIQAVAAFLEALGTNASASDPDPNQPAPAPSRPHLQGRIQTSVPASVAKTFGQQRRVFASRDAFDEALDTCMAECAWKRLLSMTGARERSTRHIEHALRDEGFPTAVARRAVDRARSCQLVDDARFAETFIRVKLRAGWGRQRIERALDQEGIDPHIVTDYPEAFFSDGTEEQRAWEALLRKPVPERNAEQKLARFLAGRGFSPSLCLRLAKKRVQQSSD
ncbi:MAG: RecX family transcriptional regulator [Coriobacteriia bacterium]|nr:RecX family transcriptional regulator [Coriobacteriia bacterium]